MQYPRLITAELFTSPNERLRRRGSDQTPKERAVWKGLPGEELRPVGRSLASPRQRHDPDRKGEDLPETSCWSGGLANCWTAPRGLESRGWPVDALLAVHSPLPHHLCRSFTECSFHRPLTVQRHRVLGTTLASTGLKSEETHEYDAGKN